MPCTLRSANRVFPLFFSFTISLNSLNSARNLYIVESNIHGNSFVLRNGLKSGGGGVQLSGTQAVCFI